MIDTTAPRAVHHDPRYHDLCGFFATMPPGQEWTPDIGDLVVRRPGDVVGIITHIAQGALHVTVLGPQAESYVVEQARGVIWLPTLDRLRTMMLEAFGTTGVFTSQFNGRAWWFSGNIMGMTVTNLVPLAEGGSAEEAAINALLMNNQR